MINIDRSLRLTSQRRQGEIQATLSTKRVKLFRLEDANMFTPRLFAAHNPLTQLNLFSVELNIDLKSRVLNFVRSTISLIVLSQTKIPSRKQLQCSGRGQKPDQVPAINVSHIYHMGWFFYSRSESGNLLIHNLAMLYKTPFGYDNVQDLDIARIYAISAKSYWNLLSRCPAMSRDCKHCLQ